MPVTKTAKRALRASEKKALANKTAVRSLEIAVRTAKKSKSKKDFTRAISLIDRAAKNNIVHKNKAARMKSQLSKLVARKVKKPSKK